MNEHAVRWPIRYIRRSLNTIQWTKWHWTLDGNFTMCDRPITLLPDNCPVMPESSDDISKVDCKLCKTALRKREDYKMVCEKCLADARKIMIGTGETERDAYLRLLLERADNPCSPREQAGEYWDDELRIDRRKAKPNEECRKR